MCMYLRTKFQVASIILEGGGGNFIPPTSKRTPKKLTQIRIKAKSLLRENFSWWEESANIRVATGKLFPPSPGGKTLFLKEMSFVTTINKNPFFKTWSTCFGVTAVSSKGLE